MRIFAALLLLVLSLLPARAGDAPTEAVHSVIGRQIAAFKADDGAAAYDFAAPSIRRVFPNADVFMSMVRSGYQPVYRARSFAFGRLAPLGDDWAQEVFLIGPDGASYTALYTLERQDDGSWKISGCQIVKTPGNAA